MTTDRNAKMKKRSNKGLDFSQIAKRVVDIATGNAPKEEPEELTPEQQAARLLGSKGGLKGGPARAKKLSKKRRSEIARKAVRARWKKARKPA